MRGLVIAAGAALLACRTGPAPATADSLRAFVAGREWQLVEAPGQPAPLGANGRPATIRFDSAGARVSGYAGCNRYGAPVTVRDDSLRIGPVVLTRMACANDPGLEPWFVHSLERVRRAERSGEHLVLVTEQSRRLRFVPPAGR